MRGTNNQEVERNLQLIRLGYRFGKEGRLSLKEIETLVKEWHSTS